MFTFKCPNGIPSGDLKYTLLIRFKNKKVAAVSSPYRIHFNIFNSLFNESRILCASGSFNPSI
jgi:hypothetical protein